jgi:hypothetical protein
LAQAVQGASEREIGVRVRDAARGVDKRGMRAGANKHTPLERQTSSHTATAWMARIPVDGESAFMSARLGRADDDEAREECG